MKKIKLSVLFLLLSAFAFAQKEEVAAAAATAQPSDGLTSSQLLIVLLLLFSVVLLLVSITLLNAFKVMYNEQLNPAPYMEPVSEKAMDYNAWLKQKQPKLSIWAKLLSLRPMEDEKDLIIEHSYDGIKELNNPVPAWFNILFFATVIFAVGYLFYYHIGGYGELQDQEYATEMASAKVEQAAYLAKSANTIDENSVKVDNTPTVLADGKTIFSTNCAVCHGDKAQGIIGPNLTDEFWLHGGGINNIFKTIKYGVTEKGMVSWEKTLSPKQMSAVSNFVLSLAGTNPAGAKPPQGEKFEAKNPEDNSMKPIADTVATETVIKQ